MDVLMTFAVRESSVFRDANTSRRRWLYTNLYNIMIFCVDTQFVNDRQVYETEAKCVPPRRVRLRYAAPQVMFKDKFIPIEQYCYILSWFVHGTFTGTKCIIFSGRYYHHIWFYFIFDHCRTSYEISVGI